ncbi:hypothetical protein AL755_04690 [Arthrobacter sp. ERGS1:01]|uniref:helicase-associated domain-containing protein n=1 Tax=Arthrobacter sp. ERGS1:01 TaxID=1704044 RepID=UPI0006CB6267|nr:helicase-associated domain-containing protein [Arthrobacter sp. ERGS1:01]ALE07561.1 hypothetical protein AL755_04690 [Arthrobacter sp. ERGS1:01]
MSTLEQLTADLASRDDAALLALLRLRPELMEPPAADFAALAARATSRAGLARALDRLNQPQLQLLTALTVIAEPDAAFPGATAEMLAAAADGATAAQAASLAAQLCRLALVVPAPAPEHAGPDDAGGPRFLPVTNVREMLGAHPAGLGRSYRELAAALPGGRDALDRAVATAGPAGPGAQSAQSAQDAVFAGAPDGTAELLAKLVPGPPLGVVGTASRGPVDWLLGRGLLAAVDKQHVELPREVGLLLRGGHVITHFEDAPPAVKLATVRISLRDNAALSAVAALLRTMSRLLDSVARTPLPTLRTGGVGVRPVRGAAKDMDVDVAQSYFYLELAAMAGLIVLDPDSSQWRADAQGWLERERAEQWLWLVSAWLDADRMPSLIGTGQPVVTVLGGGVHRPDAAYLRATVLGVLATLRPERVEEAKHPKVPAPTAEQLAAHYAWHHPRPARRISRALPGFLAEAEILGLTGAGALTETGASVIARDWDAAIALVAPALPKPVDHVLLQGDLTAIAPGYLSPALSAELTLLADQEGAGAAGVHRFSAASIQRGLSSGRSAADILDFLTEHSATPIPQPLEYLVNDTAARHGRITLGAAATFITADDAGRLAELLAGDVAVRLGLTAIAPTVAVSARPPAEVARALRAAGVSPAVLGGTQAVQETTGRGSAAPETGAHAAMAPYEAARILAGLTDDDGDAVVVPLDPAREQLALLRSRPAWSPGLGESATALVLERLRRAVDTDSLVLLMTAAADGQAERLLVRALSLAEGRLRVAGPDGGWERWIPASRIIDAELVADATEGTP